MSFRGGGGAGDGDGGGGGRWDVGAAWEPGRGGTCTGREVYVREGSEGRSSSKCITSLMQVQVPVPVQVGQLQEILYCMYSSIYFSHQQQHQCPFLLPITSIPHPPHHLPLRTSGLLSNLPAKDSLKSLHDWKGLKGSEYSRLCAFITTYHTSSNVKDRLFR